MCLQQRCGEFTQALVGRQSARAHADASPRPPQSTERRLVETGRVCLCNYGANLGKLCVIVNVLDGRRVLVDGPSSVNGLKRQVLPLPSISPASPALPMTPAGGESRVWGQVERVSGWKHIARVCGVVGLWEDAWLHMPALAGFGAEAGQCGGSRMPRSERSRCWREEQGVEEYTSTLRGERTLRALLFLASSFLLFLLSREKGGTCEDARLSPLRNALNCPLNGPGGG